MTKGKSPTPGQRRILQFASRANRRLRGYQMPRSAEVVYRIVELAPMPWDAPRFVQSVHPRMVKSLVAAGWIERIPNGMESSETDWAYRVTEAGIRAAHAPIEES